MKCKHCGKTYETEDDFLNDCFMSSDGWSWDYFHNCLEKKGLEIHGCYFKKEGTNND